MYKHDRATRSRRPLPIMAALLFMLLTAPTWAQESFRATHFAQIDGESERPNPITTDAAGVAIMRLDTAARRLEYRITVSDLENVQAAHFHAAPPDTSGPVVHPIVLPESFAVNHTVTGVWENISPADINRLQRGTIYINFHTTANPGGEIRGAVTRIPNLVANLVSQTIETATGDILINLDQAAGRLEYVMTFEGLTGQATAASFRRGTAGTTGDVAQTITLGGRTGRAAGVWSNISAGDMAALLSGGIYVSVETAANPTGEIRGQIMQAEGYSAAISPQNEENAPTNSQSAGTGFILVISASPTASHAIGGFSVGGTTGPVQAAHVHEGAIGVSGPVLYPMFPMSEATTDNWQLVVLAGVNAEQHAAFRSGNTYANFHTEQWPAGELRGQMIPAQFNLATVSSVAVESEARAGNMLTASVERNSGAVSFTIGSDVRGSNRTIALYSSIGTQVGSSTVDGDRLTISTDHLAAGLYFAQLVVDGRPVGVCRVMLSR